MVANHAGQPTHGNLFQQQTARILEILTKFTQKFKWNLKFCAKNDSNMTNFGILAKNIRKISKDCPPCN